MTARARLLVVEDAEPVRDVLREALGRAGFDVDTASTASEAIDHLATRGYAVIVADCTLPDLPALDWLASLRRAAPTRRAAAPRRGLPGGRRVREALRPNT